MMYNYHIIIYLRLLLPRLLEICPEKAGIWNGGSRFFCGGYSAMIYVTGDMHGNISRFDNKVISKLKRGDYLIICGDFGFIWDGSRQEEKALTFLNKQKFTILFVDGCHENFDQLYKYPTTEWNGGRVRMIKPNVIHLCRGQVFTIDGTTIFAMGGGCSADLDLRQQRGTKWWPEETPTTEEMAEAVDNLYDHDLNVDFIVTHECPTKVKDLLIPDRHDNFNAMTAFFDELGRQVKYKHWFFGCMHQDKHLSSSHTALFERVLPLEVPGLKKEHKSPIRRIAEGYQEYQAEYQSNRRAAAEAKQPEAAAAVNNEDRFRAFPEEAQPQQPAASKNPNSFDSFSDFGSFDNLDNFDNFDNLDNFDNFDSSKS